MIGMIEKFYLAFYSNVGTPLEEEHVFFFRREPCSPTYSFVGPIDTERGRYSSTYFKGLTTLSISDIPLMLGDLLGVEIEKIEYV